MKYWPLPGIDAEVFKPPHPGSFGAKRKFDIHTGIDLYCPEGSMVVAVEPGTVVEVENYTGPNADDPSPWWLDTKAVLVEGESGVICYGEIDTELKREQVVLAGDKIGTTKRVLRHDKGKPTCMLHFELYKPGTKETVWWHEGPMYGRPVNLLDPTNLLNDIKREQ